MSIPKFTLRGFRRPRESVYPALGKLERKVMERAWQQSEMSVRDAQEFFKEQIAYTTLMTTLDRLYKKGLLARRKQSRAFLYSPQVTREEFEQGIAEDVLGVLFHRNSEKFEPVLACIVDAVSERDRQLLDELERLVQEKRRQLNGESNGEKE
jgi:predicted transcriptional regulator